MNIKQLNFESSLSGKYFAVVNDNLIYTIFKAPKFEQWVILVNDTPITRDLFSDKDSAENVANEHFQSYVQNILSYVQ